MESVRSNRPLNVVHDFSAQNPVSVWTVITPDSVAAVADAVARSTGPISFGGGRFSLGGQFVSPDTLHLDLRQLNQVISFSPLAKTIRVQAGMRWRDLLRFIDPHGWSPAIAQTHANFTVGGSLSANAHGANIGCGPMVDSVRSLTLVMADGAILQASREHNAELFFAAIGGYGAIGIIVEAELDLVPNNPLARVVSRLPLTDYLDSLRAQRPQSQGAVLHLAEFTDRTLTRLRAVTWYDCDQPVTEPGRLQLPSDTALVGGSFGHAISENALARWQYEYLTRPLADMRKVVHWRNFEISYDVMDLLAGSRSAGLGFIQELMIPLGRVEQFLDGLRTTLARYRPENLRIQLTQANADAGTLLGWARGDTLCVQVSQRPRRAGRDDSQAEVWGRELIEAAITAGGAPSLSYQQVASKRQFLAAYPRALELFVLKSRLDPQGRLRNGLWDRYYAPELISNVQFSLEGFENPTNSVQSTHEREIDPGFGPDIGPDIGPSIGPGIDSVIDSGIDPNIHSDIEQADTPGATERSAAPGSADTNDFRKVFDSPKHHDGFYRFLQKVYKTYPEDRFHSLIRQLSRHHEGDEAVYRNLVRELPRLRPGPLQLLRSVPALHRHKVELAQQTLGFLGSRRAINGLVEIGSHGRYCSALSRLLSIQGPIVSVNERRAGFGLHDLVERGSLRRPGIHVPLAGYAPLEAPPLVPESFDLVLCYIGLHHCPPERLDRFLASIATVLRPGGSFVLRDHDVPTIEQRTFVSLAHTVCNAGDGLSWEENVAEPRHFAPASWWSKKLEAHGLLDSGFSMPQMDDPSDNVLMAFVKPA